MIAGGHRTGSYVQWEGRTGADIAPRTFSVGKRNRRQRNAYFSAARTRETADGPAAPLRTFDGSGAASLAIEGCRLDHQKVAGDPPFLGGAPGRVIRAQSTLVFVR